MAREKLKWYDARTGQRMRKDGIERASYADTEDGRYEIQGEPPTFTAVFRRTGGGTNVSQRKAYYACVRDYHGPL